MTRDEKIKAYTMLLDGHSYAEVAKELGVTRQVVHKKFAGIHFVKNACYNKRIVPSKYINIERWLYEQELSRGQFAAMIGVSASRMSNILNGVDAPNKRIIDNILVVTQMTYEDAFAEREMR